MPDFANIGDRLKAFVANGLTALNIATQDALAANAKADAANASADANTAMLLAQVAADTTTNAENISDLREAFDNLDLDDADAVAAFEARLDRVEGFATNLSDALPDIVQNPDVALPPVEPTEPVVEG